MSLVNLPEFYNWLRITGKLYEHPLADLLKLYDEYSKPTTEPPGELPQYRKPRMKDKTGPGGSDGNINPTSQGVIKPKP